MRNSFRLAGIFAAAITFLFIGSCEKIGDFIVFPRNGDDDIKACNITRITTGSTEGIVYDFTYNKKGDPVSILASHASVSDSWFKYDKWHRLIQFHMRPENIPPIANIDFLFLSKYVYDNKGHIVTDSAFFNGNFADLAAGNGNLSYVEHLEYDSKHRIIKVTRDIFPGPTPFVTNYQYDTNGNLIEPGRVYTDKLTMARTNKIWMFLLRDYSVNDYLVWEKYNKYHLPVKSKPDLFYPQFLPDVFISNSVIEYKCD